MLGKGGDWDDCDIPIEAVDGLGTCWKLLLFNEEDGFPCKGEDLPLIFLI